MHVLCSERLVGGKPRQPADVTSGIAVSVESLGGGLGALPMIDHQPNELRHTGTKPSVEPLRTVPTPYYHCVHIRTCRISLWLNQPGCPVVSLLAHRLVPEHARVSVSARDK